MENCGYWPSRGFNPQAARFWEWVRADSKSTCGIALLEKKGWSLQTLLTVAFMEGSTDQQIYLQTGIRACQTTPLIGRDGNTVVGMISTHWSTLHQPSEADFQLFDTLATQAADVIEAGWRLKPEPLIPQHLLPDDSGRKL